MGKVYAYMVFMVFFILVFNLAMPGHSTQFRITNNDSLNQSMGLSDPASFGNLTNTTFWDIIKSNFFLLIGVEAAAGLLISYITKTSLLDIYKATVGITVLALFILDLIEVVKILNSDPTTQWISWVVFLIFAPLSAAYLIALFDWVGGTD